jgi:flagellar hook assembly protein FlgD
VVFAALVVATFGAFFVAQQLKSTPSLVRKVGVSTLASPTKDGRYDRAYVRFAVRRDDTVDVTMIDSDGTPVKELASGREMRARRRIELKWDGTDDRGRPVRDGPYRVRLDLLRAGRSVVLPGATVIDTTPPTPRVLSVGPDDDALPELLPRRDGAPATIRFIAPGIMPSVEIWRTDAEPRRVATLEVGELQDGVGTTEWDGTAHGRPVPGGTYLAVVRSRDEAGNIGASVPEPLSRVRGRTLPGRGGISVRYLGVQAPSVPVQAGEPIHVAVDARGQRWSWALRAVGESVPARRGRRGEGGPFTIPAPRGESKLYLLEVRRGKYRSSVPVAVDGKRRRNVLVVLPATTWQGRNPIDDDGDGLPNTLELGVSARLDRVMAGNGLPRGLAENEGPLLVFLARNRVRFDVTTDAALAAGVGPKLQGHNGVLLAGDTVWLTEELRRTLRRFVSGGGALASFGTGSLRREVRQEDGRLLDPSAPAPLDLFGERLSRLREERVDVTNLEDDPRVRLFEGAEGLFPGVERWEETIDAGREGELASSAVTIDGRQVVVGLRFGRGLVIRPGIAGFGSRLSQDRASSELALRTMTLLSAARPAR